VDVTVPAVVFVAPKDVRAVQKKPIYVSFFRLLIVTIRFRRDEYVLATGRRTCTIDVPTVVEQL